MLTQWCEGGPSSGFMVIRKLQKFSAPGARNSDLQAPPPPPRVNACLLARRHTGHSVMAGVTPTSWLDTNTNYREYHCDPLPVLKAYPESCLFIQPFADRRSALGHGRHLLAQKDCRNGHFTSRPACGSKGSFQLSITFEIELIEDHDSECPGITSDVS